MTILALAALMPASARASDWALCPPQPPLPKADVPTGAPGVTHAAAESLRSQDELTILEGDVGIRRDGRHVTADRVELERRENRVEAHGNVSFATGDFAITGERGRMWLDTGALSVEQADYRMPALHVQGGASHIERDDRGVSRLEDATWSTCPAGDEAWHIAGGRVELDPNSRQGTARNVTLWFQGVPLFYSPWFRFPLGSQRMSGFLTPRIGTSSESGTVIAVPWYWNIAPNFDATLTPAHHGDRGAQLQSEWRWLGPAGHWQLNNEYLPDDRRTGEDRIYTRLRQRATFGRWRTRIDAADASDRDYFDDLGGNLALSSQTHLRRRADLHWRGGGTRFRARVQGYQTLDEDIAAANRPYEQLPQLTLGHRGRPGPLETRFDSELVRFNREDSDTGERLRLVPAVTWPLEAPGWFLRPRLALDHTSYRLDRVTSAGPERIDRTLPISSLDSGLIFDRFSEDYQQTLEPRLFYTHIPEEQQDDIPVFDSGRYSFSFAQLFRERRFTGGDRIGDTNRLSLALTTRLLDRNNGRELLRASVGGIRYFEDREVRLPSGQPDDPLDEAESDVIAELAANPTPHWGGDLTVQWDPDDDRADQGDFSIRYRGPDGGVGNLGYRFRRDQQEQVDASLAWPLAARWQLVGRVNWSLRDERNVESLAGFQYDDCCWRFRAVARRYINDDDSADGIGQSRSIYFELTLKGLGALGDPAGSLLERAILGYPDPTD